MINRYMDIYIDISKPCRRMISDPRPLQSLFAGNAVFVFILDFILFFVQTYSRRYLFLGQISNFYFCAISAPAIFTRFLTNLQLSGQGVFSGCHYGAMDSRRRQVPFFLLWKTHHIFFASLTVDARQTEINRTFSLLTLLDRLKRDIFSPFLISKPWVQERESPTPVRRSANTTKSGVSKTSRWRSIEKRKGRKKQKKCLTPKKRKKNYEK